MAKALQDVIWDVATTPARAVGGMMNVFDAAALGLTPEQYRERQGLKNELAIIETTTQPGTEARVAAVADFGRRHNLPHLAGVTLSTMQRPATPYEQDQLAYLKNRENRLAGQGATTAGTGFDLSAWDKLMALMEKTRNARDDAEARGKQAEMQHYDKVMERLRQEEQDKFLTPSPGQPQASPHYGKPLHVKILGQERDKFLTPSTGQPQAGPHWSQRLAGPISGAGQVISPSEQGFTYPDVQSYNDEGRTVNEWLNRPLPGLPLKQTAQPQAGPIPGAGQVISPSEQGFTYPGVQNYNDEGRTVNEWLNRPLPGLSLEQTAQPPAAPPMPVAAPAPAPQPRVQPANTLSLEMEKILRNQSAADQKRLRGFIEKYGEQAVLDALTEQGVTK